MNRHATDLVSLVFGALFVAIAGVWLFVRTVHLDLPSFGWFVAGGLIVLGAVGVIGSLRSGRQPGA